MALKMLALISGVLRELWRKCPGALVGIPTGEITGIDILDLDAKHATARDWWHDNRHRLPPTRTHRTRSGGLHLLSGKVALGVDTRGRGSYAIWWPATGLPVLADVPLAQWPDWLLDEFRPKRARPPNSGVKRNYFPQRWLAAGAYPHCCQCPRGTA
jgi:hypothetical protein